MQSNVQAKKKKKSHQNENGSLTDLIGPIDNNPSPQLFLQMKFVVDTYDFRQITGAQIAANTCVGSKCAWRVSGLERKRTKAVLTQRQQVADSMRE